MARQLLLFGLLAAVLLSEFIVPIICAEWTYSGMNDPDKWPGVCRTGQYQSPIDIGEMGIQEISFEPLAMINYEGYFNMTLTNNGHTVQLTMHHPNRGTITAGGLQGVYYLEQAHFHWPSEHTLLGKKYPLELHFVHYDRKYLSVEKALFDPEGVAVLAVIFHESPNRNTMLDPLIEGVQSVGVKTYTSKGLMRLQKLQTLLPQDTNKFYRYHGSLTTPGCNESVVWTIFTETIPISKDQIQAFRQVKTKSGAFLERNNRPLQQQNDRVLYFQTSPAPRVEWISAGSGRLQAEVLLMFAFVIAVGLM
ncbi:putative carbonic anhydrase 3 [Anabrus simplex]|uniref:putative carbonic anhydrase 3 n=1 Tax=Anabrus simplex TaxID=316456 RepID=UPI0035A36785